MGATTRIFISYRRADTRGYAHAIYNLLVPAFGKENVFMDVDAIQPGQDFVQVLNTSVNKCHVLLALIGPEWLEIKDNNGLRRLNNPHDFVRLEIETALKNGIQVIPVLLEGAHMPASHEMPGDLKALATRQAFIIGDHLAPDMERLVRIINGPGREQSVEKSAKIPWISWFFLSFFAIPPIFFLFMLVVNFIWYYTSGYQHTSSYMFIALEGAIESHIMFAYLAACEGLVSVIQWLVFLRGRSSRGSFWLISNALFGLISGFALDLLIGYRLIINEAASNLILVMFFLWLLYNVFLGPRIVSKGS